MKNFVAKKEDLDIYCGMNKPDGNVVQEMFRADMFECRARVASGRP
jgi:hypothetical protein